jgi:serine/threonine protein phosphatase 1
MTNSRTIVIADIHGCNRTLRHLIFEVVRLKKHDTLYLLGDMIDRGLDSKGVIDTIIELQTSGYDVRAIRGNHEQLLLTYMLDPRYENLAIWLANGGDATLQSYGVDTPEELVELLRFLNSLPLYRTTDSHIFVHAGMDFKRDDPFSGEDAILWKRGGDVNEAKLNGRVLVSGHTPQSLLQIRRSLGRPHIRLDNGCVQGGPKPRLGNLVALELESGVLHVQENIEPRKGI